MFLFHFYKVRIFEILNRTSQFLQGAANETIKNIHLMTVLLELTTCLTPIFVSKSKECEKTSLKLILTFYVAFHKLLFAFPVFPLCRYCPKLFV